MTFQKSIKYSAFIASSLLVSSCGDTSNDGNNAGSGAGPFSSSTINPLGRSSQPGFKISSLGDGAYVALTYNGFSGTASQYAGNAQNLIKDLSVSNAANLYLLALYVKAVGTREKPSTGTALSYPMTLASGLKIDTGLTLLSPALAMNSTQPGISSFKDKVIPSATNPVILTIPAGLKTVPETPFFPKGTKYTGVLAESQTTAGSHSAILSIETSTTNPVEFGAFGHTSGSPLDLRFYDNSSTIEASSLGSQIPLLSKTTAPGVIKARFLSLVSNNLPVMSLNSMDQATFGELGLGSGELLSLLRSAFPALVEEKMEGGETVVYPIFNSDHGIFCLGGKNKFDTVNLDHQTFVYPQSSRGTNTTIDTLNVSADSGFIINTENYMIVNTLNGNGTLKLIAVLNDGEPAAQPFIQVGTLNGVNKVNVVIGKVAGGFTLPADGLWLLSYADKAAAITTATEDAHMGGVLYDGETKVEDGKVILTQLVKKPAAIGSGTIHRLLSWHPETQGISGQGLRTLAATLDPLTKVHYHVGALSTAHMDHAANLQLDVPSSTHIVMPISNHLNMSASNMLNHTVVSSNLNYQTHGLGVTASVYGVTSDKQETSVGSMLTGFKHIAINQGVITPSVAVGYASNSLKDIDLSTSKIQVSLRDIALNSFFARLMTTVKHTQDNLTASLAAGVEARHAIFSRGNAISNHTELSVKGDSLNTFHSIVEATFIAKSAQFKAALWNFNQFELTFGVSR